MNIKKPPAQLTSLNEWSFYRIINLSSVWGTLFHIFRYIEYLRSNRESAFSFSLLGFINSTKFFELYPSFHTKYLRYVLPRWSILISFIVIYEFTYWLNSLIFCNEDFFEILRCEMFVTKSPIYFFSWIVFE